MHVRRTILEKRLNYSGNLHAYIMSAERSLDIDTESDIKLFESYGKNGRQFTLKALVKTIRNVELALGDGIKRIMPSEMNNKYRMQNAQVVDIMNSHCVIPDVAERRSGIQEVG